jgi:hypothetical protein
MVERACRSRALLTSALLVGLGVPVATSAAVSPPTAATVAATSGSVAPASGAALSASGRVVAHTPVAAERVGAWEPTVTLATAATPRVSGDVTVDPAGWSVAVWYDMADRGIWGATRPPGQPWRPAERIGTGSAHRRLGLPHPQVGIDRTGTATVLWPGPGAEQRVYAARHPRGGTWSEPVPVSDPIPAEPPECRLAPQSLRLSVGPGGASVASWEWKKCRPTLLQAAYAPPHQAWSPPVTIDEHARHSQLAVDRRGTAVITYVKRSRRESDIVMVSRRPADGSWGAARSFGAAVDDDPQVAMNPRGVTVVVFVNPDGIVAVRRPVAGPWRSPVPVSRPRATGAPVVALDSSGTATIAWASPGPRQVLAARYPARGPLPGPVEVASFVVGDSFAHVVIAANGPGDVILGWNSWSPASGERVYAAFQRETGRWGSVKRLTRRNQWTPQVAIARNGDAQVLWTTGESVQARLRRD